MLREPASPIAVQPVTAGSLPGSGAEPGSGVRVFLRRLSWSMVGGLVGGLALFVMNVAAGRVLGPDDYGRASLAFVVANFCVIPLALGLDLSSARALARRDGDAAATRAIVTVALSVVAALGLVLGLTTLADPALIANLLRLDPAIWAVAVPLGIVLAVRALLDRVMAGMQRFRLQAFARIVEALVGVSALVYLLRPGSKAEFTSLPLAITFGGICLILLYLWNVKALVRPAAFQVRTLVSLLSYGRWAIVAYVTGTIIMFGDKLLVGQALGSSDLGLYTAYYVVSLGVTVQLVAVFNNVFLPAVSKIDDKRSLVRRMDRASRVAAPAGLIVIITTLFVVLHAYGDAYPWQWRTAALFAVWAVMFGLNQTYGVVVAVHSQAVYRRDMLFQPVRLSLVAGYLWAVLVASSLSIASVLGALILAEVLEFLNLQYLVRRHVIQRPLNTSDVI